MLIERKFYCDRKEVMKYMEYWSNDACEGYAIMAMEDAGFLFHIVKVKQRGSKGFPLGSHLRPVGIVS